MTIDLITWSHFTNIIIAIKLPLEIAAPGRARERASAPEVEAGGAFHAVYLPEGKASIKGCFGGIVEMKIPNESSAAGKRKLGSLTQLTVSDMPFYWTSHLNTDWLQQWHRQGMAGCCYCFSRKIFLKRIICRIPICPLIPKPESPMCPLILNAEPSKTSLDHES